MRTSTRTAALFATAALTTVVLAGCGDGGEDPAAGSGAAVAADASNALEVEAGDLYFDPERLSASAGEIEITLVNVGVVEHDLVIEETGDTVVVYADAGETVTGTIELAAGTYTFYCSIPGHRGGMEGTLEVS